MFFGKNKGIISTYKLSRMYFCKKMKIILILSNNLFLALACNDAAQGLVFYWRVTFYYKNIAESYSYLVPKNKINLFSGLKVIAKNIPEYDIFC